MANETSAGPEPAREPPKKQVKETDAPAQASHSETAGHARIQLQTTSPSGNQTIYESDSPWQAMHRLAGRLNQDSSPSAAPTSITLTDPGAKYGVVFARNDAGEMGAQFQSSDAQALYRQVVRERQMELASPADNRISAAAPQRSTAVRKAERASRAVEPSAEELRRSILDRLEAREQREQSAPSNKADRSQAAELDCQVLERASAEQLRRLQQVAEESPAVLDKAIRKLQQQIERDVARDDKDDEKTPATVLRVGPPVEERFTVQERLGRRDYWQRDRPDRLAFTQTWLSLRTKEHGAAALMGMVDRAVELGWKRLHLQGTPEFKREAWIIAASRGIRAYGYTATLGDREAAQAERRRLTEPAPVRTLQRQTEAPVLARDPEPGQKQDRAPSIEQWRQVVRKAIADGKVAPELEDRLTQLLSKEAQRRRAQGKAPIVQVWDPASARAVSKQRAPAARGQKEIQRER